MYQLKKCFRMKPEEMEFLDNLPENLPGNKLTEKQRTEVMRIYHHYITRHIDNVEMRRPLYKDEMGEKWPSGPRVKEHEAKRMVLTWLLDLNQNHRAMTDTQAACFFFRELTCRPTYVRLLSNIYQRKGGQK